MQQPSQASNTRLPRQVLRRSAAIEARYAPKPPESENPNPADPNAPAASGAPAIAPAPPAEPATPPAPAGDPRDTDPVYWKQRFQVTDGLLKRARIDHRTETDALHQQITDRDTQIRTLKVAPGSTTPAAVDIAKYFTPAQIEQYGEEQCGTMARAAEAAAEAKATELINAAVQPLKDAQVRNDSRAVEDAKAGFYAALAEAYPAYSTADVDPSWLEYLEAHDDSTGMQRQRILDIHIRNLDARACAKMFKAWEATKVAAAPPAPPMPPIGPSGSGAAPGENSVAAPPPGPGGALTIPTAAEIKLFYKNAALNKVTDSERSTFEARLALRNPR